MRLLSCWGPSDVASKGRLELASSLLVLSVGGGAGCGVLVISVVGCSLLVISLLGCGAFCCFWLVSMGGAFSLGRVDLSVVAGAVEVFFVVGSVFLFAHWLA